MNKGSVPNFCQKLNCVGEGDHRAKNGKLPRRVKMSAGAGGGNDDKCLDQFNGINILPPIIRSEN